MLQSACTIPNTDSFSASNVTYTGGITMFTAAGEVSNPATIAGFIAVHPYFSAAGFSEPYTQVALHFSPGNKATFIATASGLQFNT